MVIDKKVFESERTGTRLDQVKQFLKERPLSAFTSKEIASALGIESENNISSLLINLEYHGFIKRKRIGKIVYNMWKEEQ